MRTLEMAKLAAERLGDTRLAIVIANRLFTEPELSGGEGGAPSGEGGQALADALAMLAGLYDREKRYPALAEIMHRQRQLARDTKEAVGILERLGALYSDRLGATAQAAAIWQEILDLDPQHGKALRTLRELYAAAGDYDGLERLYARIGMADDVVEALLGVADRLEGKTTRLPIVERRRGAGRQARRREQPPRRRRAGGAGVGARPGRRRRARGGGDGAGAGVSQGGEVGAAAQRAGDPAVGRRGAAGSADAHGGDPRDLRAEARLQDAGLLVGAAPPSSWIRRAQPCAASWCGWPASPISIATWRTCSDGTGMTSSDPSRSGWRSSASRRGCKAASSATSTRRRALYREIWALVPDDDEAETQLEEIALQLADWADLRTIYQHQLGRQQDATDRTRLLLELASIEEEKLVDLDAAAATYERVLALDERSAVALRALSRVHEARGDWEALVATLIRELSREEDPARRIELSLRIGGLEAQSLDRHDRALPHFEAALATAESANRSAGAAVAVLARYLATTGPGASISAEQRSRLARKLAPHFAASASSLQLAGALELMRQGEGASAAEQLELDRRLLRLYHGELADQGAAWASARRIVEAEPTDGDARGVLRALTSVLGRDGELAEIPRSRARSGQGGRGGAGAAARAGHRARQALGAPARRSHRRRALVADGARHRGRRRRRVRGAHRAVPAAGPLPRSARAARAARRRIAGSSGAARLAAGARRARARPAARPRALGGGVSPGAGDRAGAPRLVPRARSAADQRREVAGPRAPARGRERTPERGGGAGAASADLAARRAVGAAAGAAALGGGSARGAGGGAAGTTRRRGTCSRS